MNKTFEKVEHPLLDALLEELRQRTGTAVKVNDAALCRLLKVQPAVISRFRRGTPISDSMRVAVMREFKWPIRKLDELAPPAARGEGAQQ